jgi:VRR-NUC domain
MAITRAIAALLVRTEHQEQVELFRLAALHEAKYPALATLYAVPNAGKRTPRMGAWMKAEGLRAGFPDTVLPVARQGFHGLEMELKRADGGRVSPEQRWWHDALRAEGHRVEVCHGAAAAWAILLNYLA